MRHATFFVQSSVKTVERVLPLPYPLPLSRQQPAVCVYPSPPPPLAGASSPPSPPLLAAAAAAVEFSSTPFSPHSLAGAVSVSGRWSLH